MSLGSCHDVMPIITETENLGKDNKLDSTRVDSEIVPSNLLYKSQLSMQ